MIRRAPPRRSIGRRPPMRGRPTGRPVRGRPSMRGRPTGRPSMRGRPARPTSRRPQAAQAQQQARRRPTLRLNPMSRFRQAGRRAMSRFNRSRRR